MGWIFTFDEVIKEMKKRENETETAGIVSKLDEALYSAPPGWANVGVIETILEEEGFTVTALERDNWTDGEYHKRFKRGDDVFDLNANQWNVSTFKPLADWLKGI
jgi:hypothetical protein